MKAIVVNEINFEAHCLSVAMREPAIWQTNAVLPRILFKLILPPEKIYSNGKKERYGINILVTFTHKVLRAVFKH